MLSSYAPGLTIERKDNDGHYSKDNCRWATKQEQNLNTSRTNWIEFNGERKPLKVWADTLKIDRRVLDQRLRRGWPVDLAFTTAINTVRGPNARARARVMEF